MIGDKGIKVTSSGYDPNGPRVNDPTLGIRKPFMEPGFYCTADRKFLIHVDSCDELKSLIRFNVVSSPHSAFDGGMTYEIPFDHFNSFKFQHADGIPQSSHLDFDNEPNHIEVLTRSRDGWQMTAEQAQRGSDYYRGLLVQIGELIGKEAMTGDSGMVFDSVAIYRVPDLVKALIEENKRLTQELDDVHAENRDLASGD